MLLIERLFYDLPVGAAAVHMRHPHQAPIGYADVRKLVDGREVRTVEIDSERAEHIKWAFQAYSTGDWTLHRLKDGLDARGLTCRPTANRTERPIQLNTLNNVLRNRYY